MTLKKKLEEVKKLLDDWGFGFGDYALFGELTLFLQGLDIKARKNHIDVVVVKNRLPWKVKAGEEAAIPPKNSKYFRSYIRFFEKTKCELHLIPLPLADLDAKNLKKRSINLDLGSGEFFPAVKLIEQIKNHYYILKTLARKDRWAEEKTERWMNYFKEFYEAAKKHGDKEILKWCGRGLALAGKKRFKKSKEKKVIIKPAKYAAATGRGIGSGKVRGRVRIIKTHKDYQKVKAREILVMSHAKPDISLVLKKISAIVTDEGGIMSHTAIISREQGIPCVIGTQIATKIFKNGDQVEVNAEYGVIRKIK